MGPRKHLWGVLVFVAMAACGYHLGAGPEAPETFGTVAVPIFINQSGEPHIQSVITTAVIRELQQAGVSVVSPKLADKILEGRIRSYGNRSVARTAASTVREYRLSAVVSLILKDRKGRILFQNPAAQLREEYFASSILEQNEQAEAEALVSGAVDFAEDQVRHMIDGTTAGLGNDSL